MQSSQPEPGPEEPSPQELRRALKAFKKRLKLTQLDEQSKLGGGPLTGARRSILAITPPDQFPRAVWEHLAKQGKLRYAGSGLYELVQQ